LGGMLLPGLLPDSRGTDRVCAPGPLPDGRGTDQLVIQAMTASVLAGLVWVFSWAFSLADL